MENIDQNIKYVVIGNPIAHSRSPQMQNAAFEFHKLGKPYGKILLEKNELADFADFMRKNLLGCNVTVPFKEAIIPFLDEVDPIAMQGKSVNTIINKNGKLFGCSTDGFGLESALRKNFDMEVADKRMFFVGAGGASQAVSWHFASLGVKKIYIANRTFEKALNLATAIKKFYHDVEIIALSLDDKDGLKNAISDSDCLIQATSSGLKESDLPPFDFELLFANRAIKIIDLIYKKTPLLEFAEKNKFDYTNGKDMLIYQGAKSFELWTDLPAPIELMCCAFEN